MKILYRFVLVNRGEKKALGFLKKVYLDHICPSKDVQDLFAERARDLGAPNPFDKSN